MSLSARASRLLGSTQLYQLVEDMAKEIERQQQDITDLKGQCEWFRQLLVLEKASGREVHPAGD